jgi:hypothetical protein
MKRARANGFILAAAVAAAGASFALPWRDLAERPGLLAALVVLAVVAGARPVRFGSRGHELTTTHPVVLTALVALGPAPAVIAAVAGAAASMVARRRRVAARNLIFNAAVVTLSTVGAWAAFGAAGGGDAAAAPVALLFGLLGATAAYFCVNTGLVSAVVAFDRGTPAASSWWGSFRWTVPSYLSGVPVALAMVVALQQVGVAGLALGLPPIWLMAGFYREHRARLAEQRERVTAVERLNDDLRRNVDELHEALAHVKRLQGLLPICMHCKSVRDEEDTWQRIDAYLAEHSELRFTHSLCQSCRDAHYPAAREVDRPVKD